MIRQTLLRAFGNKPNSKRRRSLRPQRLVERMEDRCVLAAVSGTVVEDLDGDGVIGPTDPGMPGVSVFIDANANGMLDVAGTVVEPDDFGDREAIQQEGMTFSLVDENNAILENRDIVARQNATASTGDLVFGTVADTHFSFKERLRIDFDTAVSSVTIDFIGDRPFAGDVGTLEIYDSGMQLLDSITSSELLNDEYQTLRLARAEGDIVTAIASSVEPGITGRLDALRINDAGSEISTLTDADGDYNIQNLPAGSHLVTQVVPVDFVQTFPSNNAAHDVTLGEDEDRMDLDFASEMILAESWHNADLPLDVSGDGLIVAFDALLIINELNQPEYGDPVTGELPFPPPSPVPAFFDVNDDGFVAPFDALAIINHLNNPGNPAAEGEKEPSVVVSFSSRVAAAIDDEPITDLGDLSTPIQSNAEVVIDLTMDAEPINQFVEVVSLAELDKVFDADEHRGSPLDLSQVTAIDLDDAELFLLVRNLLSGDGQ